MVKKAVSIVFLILLASFASAQIIFEDDFSGNTNCLNGVCWTQTLCGTWITSNTPANWDGYKCNGPNGSYNGIVFILL